MHPLTPKEQKILNFIKTYSEKRGYAPTYSEIQEKFQYKAISSVQQFIQQLVDKGYLQVPIGESRKRALILAKTENATEVPLEGYVAAGRLTEAVTHREYVNVPTDMLKSGADYFALKIKGDSMIEDCILDGDLAIIRRQEEANNGQTVVAIVGSDATIKRFYKKKTHIELHPANPNYDVIKIQPDEDFKILGVLASVIRRLI